MPEPMKPLPTDHGFVLQLEKCRGDAEDFRCGRVEHLATGQAARFATSAELWHFIDAVLAKLRRSEKALDLAPRIHPKEQR